MIKKQKKKNKKTGWKLKNSQLGNIENVEREMEKSQKVKERMESKKYNSSSEKISRKISRSVPKRNFEKRGVESSVKKITEVSPEVLEKKKTLKKGKAISRDSDTQNSEKTIVHKPVLLEEVIEALDLQKGDIVFDGTLGQGGYSEEILKKIEKEGILVATDLDSDALEFSKRRLKKYLSRKFFFQNNFSEIQKILKETEIDTIDKSVLDLGFGTHQLDNSKRGISFLNEDEPLNMNLNSIHSDLTAKEILNHWEEETLADIFSAFGGEKHAKLAASKIVEERNIKEFDKVGDLTHLLVGVLSPFYKKQKIHPATRIFQALRITVNSELEHLKSALENIFEKTSENGIIAIVTFHSLEDVIVKKYFRARENEFLGKRINKKVIIPAKEELERNPRSRSAKLRIFKKFSWKKKKY